MRNSRKPSRREQGREIARAAADLTVDPEIVREVAGRIADAWRQLPGVEEFPDAETLEAFAEATAKIAVEGAALSGVEGDPSAILAPLHKDFMRQSLAIELRSHRKNVAVTAALSERVNRLAAMLDEWNALGQEGRWSRHGNALCGKMLTLVEDLQDARAAFANRFPDEDEPNSFAADMIEYVESLRDSWKAEVAYVAEEDRVARLEQRRAERKDPVIVERRCANCQKKPARIDDLCKKCAHEAGTLVRGKIGEG